MKEKGYDTVDNDAAMRTAKRFDTPCDTVREVLHPFNVTLPI
jgi:hypothetical protein